MHFLDLDLFTAAQYLSFKLYQSDPSLSPPPAVPDSSDRPTEGQPSSPSAKISPNSIVLPSSRPMCHQFGIKNDCTCPVLSLPNRPPISITLRTVIYFPESLIRYTILEESQSLFCCACQ
ncbi:hypothetical protein BS47DRAFT_1352028 [Hydnum rufescens UP504]|uniref:Uncharacterized protein n=1 Tax=Hydnum rufescens UP504 TaxID=1448309 RepID=A0A9P6AK17_9AGAM|nr:hypothetical protein BS47DRAFT_1352028 [Hydnum rufescens UP504]